MDASNRFARRVFLGAGIYGLLVLLPQYLVETGVGPALPSPMQRPELFYGFVGVAVAWQAAFLVIAGDVQRYRLLMLPAILEKFFFGFPVLLLFAAHRVGSDVLFFGSIDLVLGAPFAVAFRRTRISSAGT